MVVWIAQESALENAITRDSVKENVLIKQPLPFEPTLKIVPYVLEGSVENFDPVARAKELAKTLPRKWCGTFTPFGNENALDVSIRFSSVTPIGQMLTLKGDMVIGPLKTPLSGVLNAKSDQLELIPISDRLLASVEPGGLFMGFQGFSLTGWKPSRLTTDGGRLQMSQICDK